MGLNTEPKWRPRAFPYDIRCQRCDRTFRAKRRDALYCSPACRKYAQRSREQLAAAQLAAAQLAAGKPKLGK